MKEHLIDLALILGCGAVIVLTWFIVSVGSHNVHKNSRW